MKVYRQSQVKSEIIGIIERIAREKLGVRVWQKNDYHPDSLKEAPLTTLTGIFPDDGIFFLDTTCLQGKIDRNHETYFYIEAINIVFKTTNSVSSKDHSSFRFPKEIRLEEMRAFERTYFKPEQKEFVECVFPTQDASRKNLKTSCSVLNISQKGIRILVTKETISNIDYKKKIILPSIYFSGALYTGIVATIRNANKHSEVKLHSDEQYSIGLEFDFPLGVEA